MNKSISVVIPCFNEEKRLFETLHRIDNYFTNKGVDFEVIVVDDGSIDSTVKSIKAISNEIKNLSLYVNPHNMGKGYSIGLGISKSKYEYILFTDADMSTPIEEFDKFLARINDGKKIIIGSRKMAGANVIVKQPVIREFMGKAFTRLSNLILGTNFSDFTCGFKCFETSVAKEIFSKSRINRWSFDSEILYLTKKLNYDVVEVPVTWHDDRATKVNLKKDILGSFTELIKIRMIHK